ncbi:MAG TPA: fumarylacetoacetate hydrolase family protein [Desulfitobacterium dehalogenans]|uniref:Fumarylacetoacetate hydrolase family protein n=1 Tax=Desulfitobacterium dehalogenans TaxID=36854 RepID=A0A7C6Z6Z6_9FIRM|nr:fumarylacetoacetate hydrolase family protein [Desulfitobacterium dehalogenans]
MGYIRFLYEDKICFGQLQGESIEVLDRSYLEQGCRKTGQILQAERVRLLSPVEPTKIVCIGLNYAKHIEELGHTLHDDPVIFLKPVTSLVGPEDEIILPPMSQQVEYEAELVVVMGKTAKDITEDQAEDYIFGFTCGNDVTARDLQKKDGQWTRSKSFDTFCPIGPWVVTDLDHRDVKISSVLNGEVKQSAGTSSLINSVPKLVSYISQIMTLNPGDLIMTGTPEGVGPMKAGDVIDVEIEGIGRLRNLVR